MKTVSFWLAVLICFAVLMFGRFAPFYQYFYALPYASTIRNPVKFLHIFSWVMLIVAGYGLHGLTTLYLDRAVASSKGILEQFWRLVAEGPSFDKKWVLAMFGLVVMAGTVAYTWGSHPRRELHRWS